jgi:O-antigen/teichoic acid export membrane protein
MINPPSARDNPASESTPLPFAPPGKGEQEEYEPHPNPLLGKERELGEQDIGCPVPAKPKIDRSRPLGRNVWFSLVGNATFQFCQWAMVSAIAKLGTKVYVGEYSFALAITAPIFFFASLNLRTVQATDARETHKFGEYLGLRIVALAASIVLITAIGIVMHLMPPKRDGVALLGNEGLAVLVWVTLARTFDWVSDLIYGLELHHERMDLVSRSMILRGALQLLILGPVMLVTRNIVLSVACVALASCISTIANDCRYASIILSHDGHRSRHIRWPAILPTWDPAVMKTLTLLSLPLGIAASLGMLNVSIPRYYLQRYGGPAEVGEFSAMASLLYFMGLISASTLQGIMPRLAHCLVVDIPQFWRIAARAMLVSIACGIAGILMAHFLGRRILTLLYKAEYGGHPHAFEWIMAAAAMYYIASAFGCFLQAARIFKPQPVVYGMSVLACILLCWYYVPRHGIIGASWAYFGTNCVWALGFGVVALVALSRNAAGARPSQPRAMP